MAAVLAIAALGTVLCGCSDSDDSTSTVSFSGKTAYEFDPEDYIDVYDYSELRLSMTESELEAAVQNYMNSYVAGSYEQLEGTVKDGDTVNIDYVGRLNGVAFEGGTAESYDLEIGSDSFIDGFEDGLIGVSTGETVDLKLTFPENYPSDSGLAGQETVFTVTVNYIRGAKYFTDEDRENAHKKVVISDLLNQIQENSEYSELPEKLYEKLKEDYSEVYGDYLMMYYGYTESNVNVLAEEYAESQAKLVILYKIISENEKITVTDNDYKLAIAAMIINEQSFKTEAEVEVAYSKDEINQYALEEKVNEYLYSNYYLSSIKK